MLKEADPEFGDELADFILKGVPNVAAFPRTNLFRNFTDQELSNYEKQQRDAEKKFRTREKDEAPTWVTDKQLAAAFETFIKKSRDPVEEFMPFSELTEPVYVFPVFQGDKKFDKLTNQWIWEKIRNCYRSSY